LETVVKRSEGPFECYRSAQLNSCRPFRQRKMGQGEKHVHRPRVDVTAEDGTKGHPYGDDDESDQKIKLEGSCPGRLTTTLSHDESEDAEHKEKQDRIRSSTHCYGKTQGPQPPCHGMQAAREHPTSSQVLARVHRPHTQPDSARLRRQAANPPAPAKQTIARAPITKGTADPSGPLEVAGEAETLTILGPGRRPEAGIPDFVELDEGGVLVEEDFLPPPPRASEVAVVGAVDAGDFPLEVVVEVFVETGVDVVRGEVLVVLSVVGLADEVVVVGGGPGLFARTELGENGGWTFGSLAPNVHASALPGGGS
jgi:hypothetical protein